MSKIVTSVCESVDDWYRCLCPSCSKANWVSGGDPSDCTGSDPAVIRCWNCDECFLIDEILNDVQEWTEDSAEDGKKSPV